MSILTEKQRDIVPENIRFDKKVFGVQGVAGKANVYLQRNEPTEKEGIWIQAKDLDYENVKLIQEIPNVGGWENENISLLPFDFQRGGACAIDTNIYLFGGSANTTTAYKYDTVLQTYTKLTDIPYEFYNTNITSVGTDIYLFGGQGNQTIAYKYNTLTDTYTQLATPPVELRYGTVIAIGTDIYITGSGSSAAEQKYDTLTDTYTEVNLTERWYYNSIANIGTDIYLFGGDFMPTSTYKYDTLTGTETPLADIPVDFYRGSAVSVGTDIYLFGGDYSKTSAYRYDTLSNSYTRIADIPYDFRRGGAVAIGDTIYLLGGADAPTSVRRFITEEVHYPDNSILLLLTDTDGYDTQLINSNIQGRLVNRISDAWYYTVMGGISELLPTSYGDGEKWICFKNEDLLLPDEEPEEEGEIPLTVSYIESDGTQYIDTGIMPANDVEFEISFNQQGSVDTSHSAILGARAGYRSNSLVFFNRLSGSFNNKGIWIGGKEDITATTYTHYQVDTVATFKNSTLTLTSSQGTESHAITMPSAFTGSYGIILFGSRLANSIELAVKMRLYYCKIWKAGELVRDFVPHLQNGEYCLLDNVSGEVFLSPNGTSFTGHSERSAQVEYIQSLGNGEYIDTGVVPTANTEVEIQYEDTEPFINYERFFAIDKQFGIMRKDANTTVYQIECGNSWTAGEATIPEGGIHTVKMGKNTVLVDGENSFSYSGKASTDKTLYLFQGNGTNEAGAFKLYYFKVWEDGTLVRDFVPYIVDDVYCLKDLVSGQYFYAQNGSPLIGGNVVTVEPPDETRLYRLSESTTFDGTSTEIDTGVAQSELANGYTILMRINAEEWNNYRGVFGLHSSAGGIVGLQYENSKIRWLHNSNATIGVDIAEADLAAGSWHTIGCVYDGGTWMTVYIDGSSHATNTVLLKPAGNIIIGKAYNSSERFFKGEISNFDIYNRAMEQDEILQKLEAMEV